MNFLVGVLSHNAVSTLRCRLLERTLWSLENAFTGRTLLVLDNDSPDGSGEWVRALRSAALRVLYHSPDGNTSPGRGRNELMRALAPFARGGDDIVVLSDDDVLWANYAEARLRRFWAAAPADLIILSGLLEPDWPWNTPRELIECGGVKALVRDSAPAAAWTFRLGDWGNLGPLLETTDGEGEDFDACQRLRAAGFRVAQIELASHIGEGYSQLGHDADRKIAGRPLDRERWGL